MKRYTGAIFDMDGVLFDTERVFQRMWREKADEMGVTLGEDFTQTICGTNGVVLYGIVERYYGVRDGAAVTADVYQRVREALSKHVPVKPGAREILAYFRDADMRIAVASSSARAQIESNLTLTGLMPFIDVIVSGDDVSRGKPDPEIFLRAAAAIAQPPERCFVFEDSLNGVRAGHAAGCATIMVPDLVAPTPEIVPLCARICDSLEAALIEVARMSM